MALELKFNSSTFSQKLSISMLEQVKNKSRLLLRRWEVGRGNIINLKCADVNFNSFNCLSHRKIKKNFNFSESLFR